MKAAPLPGPLPARSSQGEGEHEVVRSARAPAFSLSLRGTSGERTGERGSLYNVIGFLLAATLIVPGAAAGQATNFPDKYQVIVDRNAFGLKAPAVQIVSTVMTEPLEDLVLTGLIEIATCRRALFMLVEPGKPPSLFTLRVGEQNQWLELKGMDSREGTATVLLKKPLAKLRTVGEEVVVSFRNDGQKTRTAGLNRGNPHVDFPGSS